MFKVVAPQAISNFALSAVFLVGLFFGVVILHLLLNAMLRNAGLAGGVSLLVAGAIAFILVVSLWIAWQDILARRRRRHEAEREALGLPSGACCVVFRAQEGATMPWAMTDIVRVHYPKPARRSGIEGFAVVEFEISADGRAKNLHCVESWPHRLFYDAAANALRQARFRAREGERPRFGPTYRMPFVFRIRRIGEPIKDHGRLAKPARR